jgi:N-acetylneuraminic acid mutarotase
MATGAEVDVSLDGGAAWETVWHLDTPRSGPDTVTVPIPHAAGHSNVRVRFRYREGDLTAGRWWAIDDVYVGTRTCDPVPGGLVSGVLTDRNTGLPLVGGTVHEPGGATATSIATPTDDALGDGFYSLFVPRTGASELTAGRAKYRSQTSTVTLTDRQLHRADFALAAGRIETVASMTARQDVGGVTTKTLTLRNTGTADATVGITERPGGFDLLGDTDSTGAAVQRVKGTYSPFAEKAAGKSSAATGMATATAGTAWTGAADYPMSVSSSSAAAVDGRIYSVGGSSGTNGALADTFRYDPATTSWSQLARMPHARQKPAVAVLDGKLHVTGGWGISEFLGYPGDPEPALDIYDPATNEWTSGPAAPAPVAAAGTATLDGSMYVVGGCTGPEVCGTQAAYRYTPGATGWERLADYPEEVAWLNCGAIEGVLYCAGGMRPGPIVQVISLKSTYSYDPGTNTWTRRADLPMELWASASTVADGKLLVSTGITNGSTTATNQGFGYDPRTDSWSALPNATYASFRSAGACGFYKIGGGTPYNSETSFVEVLGGRTDCAGDRDSAWLSAAPSSAITLRPGQTSQVTVRFDAGAVSQPGTYTADLVIRGDTPYAPAEVNAELLADAPRRWGKLTGTVTGASCDGTLAPLPGASVWVHGRTDDFTIPTDADGRYTRWLDSRNSPATVVVGLDGWTPQTTKVKLSGGRTTTLDVTLRPASC